MSFESNQNQVIKLNLYQYRNLQRGESNKKQLKELS